MADILVKWEEGWMDLLTPAEVADRSSADPTFRVKYDHRIKRGDVVSVYPDGRLSDHAHSGGKFVIVRCPGITVEEAKELLEHVSEEYFTTGLDGAQHRAERKKLRRKKYLDVSSLPAAVLSALDATHVVTVNRTTIITRILSKI